MTTLRYARGPRFAVVGIVVLIALILVGIQTFVAQPYRVEQGDMETTLLPGQYLLVDKLTPRWAPYARGDIVVFNPPDAWMSSGAWPFVKRVIGLPGDRIELREGKVFANGVRLEEDYLSVDGGPPAVTEPSPGGATTWLVPEGALFVMGDDRRASADSRHFGPIRESVVIGRAWLRYWPIDTFGILQTPSDIVGQP